MIQSPRLVVAHITTVLAFALIFLCLPFAVTAQDVSSGGTTPTASAEVAATAALDASVAANWLPVIDTFDGVPMASVPAGCFLMGSADGTPNEQPVNEVCLASDFWIDVYEVTHDQFAAFGGVAGRAAAFADIGGTLPRERVTWFEARDLCALRGGALPSEAEWEYAARGAAQHAYPWGDVFLPGVAVVSLGPGNHPEAVGERADGQSWVGAQDLAGNLWEWVSSVYSPYPYAAHDGREDINFKGDVPRVIRGGAWSYSTELARSAARSSRPPTTETSDIGFRCVRHTN